MDPYGLATAAAPPNAFACTKSPARAIASVPAKTVSLPHWGYKFKCLDRLP